MCKHSKIYYDGKELKSYALDDIVHDKNEKKWIIWINQII